MQPLVVVEVGRGESDGQTVFFDQEKADCEDEAGQNSISHLQLTQKQYNYISSYPQIELKECKIVNNNKRKKE